MIENILKFVGGSAVLFAVIAWFVKTLVTHFLSRDIEKLKSALALEVQKTNDKIQKETQINILEHQIRFNKLHERVADVIAEAYAKLYNISKNLNLLIRTDRAVDDPDRKISYKQLNESLNDLKEYYPPRRIYFSKSISIQMDLFIHELEKTIPKFLFMFNEEEYRKLGGAAYFLAEAQNAQKKVGELLINLEINFRETLGAS